MTINELTARAVRDLDNALKLVNPEEVNKLINDILSAKNVYVDAAGRSMLVMRCFAMRLMQIGINSYVVGDTCTPAFSQEDLLIVASSSGETGVTLNVARKVKELGGKVAAFTVKRESSIGKVADDIVQIHGYAHLFANEMKEPTLPGGCLFEQSVLILSDAIIIPLTEHLGEGTDMIFIRHANLE